jgi:hypothetical protein
MLALLAAAECTVSGLILISAILSGRRYLRDLRMTRMAGAAMAGNGAAADDQKEAGAISERRIVGSFRLDGNYQ